MSDTSSSTPGPQAGYQNVQVRPDGQSARPQGGAPKHESTASVIAAIAANIAVGVFKFIAAGLSGSSALISEGIHSLVDSGNGLLVMLGIKRSEKRPDRDHPFGYGMELYFWTLIVAMMIFALGGGLSIYEGISHIREVQPGAVPGDPFWSYVVIIGAMIIEGFSLTVALRQFNASRAGMHPMEFIRKAKDPSLFTVVLEDTAAEVGLVIALLGTLLTQLTGNLYFDGAASVLIGLLLVCVSVILLRETKGLLIGEGMSTRDLRRIEALVESHPSVQECGRILTMYLGPHDVLVNLDATFVPGATRDQVMQAIDDIEVSIVREFPDCTRIFVESESIRFTAKDSLDVE